jgi:hypothetical protein
MSFLNGRGGALADGGNAAASGLGHMLNTDPSRISQIAGQIGRGMNGIAAAGGATPGYAAPEAAPANHMQLLDDAVLQKIVQQFGGGMPQQRQYAQ